MKRSALRLVIFVLPTMALAACSGGGGGSAAVTPPAPLACQFGTGFCADYAAAPTAKPAKPAQGDIVALSVTAKPTPLH